jgi:ACS family hexuronate transporter-like MFS transporter
VWFRPEERTVATGIFNVGAGLGGLIAPPLVVLLILRFGWQSAFVATGAAGMVWVAIWLLLYRSPDRHPWMSPRELAFIREGQGGDAAPGTGPRAGATATWGVWMTILSDRNFWAIAIARALSEPAWLFVTYWIPLYLSTDRHLQLKEIAYFAWLPFLAGDLGCLAGGALSPLFIRLGATVMTARKLAASTCAVLMIGAIFIGRAPTVEWAIAFFCVGAFAHQAMSSTLLTLPADVFPPEIVATASGLTGTFAILGGIIFNVVVGIVAVSIGYWPLFVPMGLFDLVGAALLWALLGTGAPRR